VQQPNKHSARPGHLDSINQTRTDYNSVHLGTGQNRRMYTTTQDAFLFRTNYNQSSFLQSQGRRYNYIGHFDQKVEDYNKSKTQKDVASS